MRGLGSLCLPGDSFPYLVLLFVEQDRKDNRRADQGGDRVDRQGALEARRAGDQVADQRQRGAGQERGGHQHPVVGSLEQRPAEVRHGQPEEVDRSAIGGDDGRQYAGRADHREAGSLDVEPQVAGVVLARFNVFISRKERGRSASMMQAKSVIWSPETRAKLPRPQMT